MSYLGARRMVGRGVLLLAGLSVAEPAAAANVACVGDSITYGYGLSDPNTESYPARLQLLTGAEHTVGNFGVGGATLLKSGDKPYWQEASFGASDNFAPDIVVIMLGTNDSKPQNWARNSEFASDYASLIDHYRALGAAVFVATPPRVYDLGAFDIPPSVVENEVAPLVEQIATDANAPLIDMFQATSEHANLFPDTVHPNAEGAQLIAEIVAAAIEEYGMSVPGAMDAGAAPDPSSNPGVEEEAGAVNPNPAVTMGGSSSASPPSSGTDTAGVGPVPSSGGMPSAPSATLAPPLIPSSGVPQVSTASSTAAPSSVPSAATSNAAMDPGAPPVASPDTGSCKFESRPAPHSTMGLSSVLMLGLVFLQRRTSRRGARP